MMQKTMLIIALVVSMMMGVSQACTVWGAITPNKLLIAKNRDYYPEKQIVKTVHNQKYKYFGLYAVDKKGGKESIRMGINEQGLVAYITFATTLNMLPENQRSYKVPFHHVLTNVLGNYKTVDQIAQNSKLLFENSKPDNYIFADRKKAMICEVGLHHQYQCQTYSRNPNGKIVMFSQTNHYIFPEVTQYNLTPIINQQTSYFRLNKINQLMNQNISDLSFKKFIDFSFNTTAMNDTPLAKFDKGYDNTYQDNSIFRTFNSQPDRKNKKHVKSDQGVSAMIVELPKNQSEPVKLYIRIIDNIVDLNDKKQTQIIKYREATTTLENVLYHRYNAENLFIMKKCKRDETTKQCS